MCGNWKPSKLKSEIPLLNYRQVVGISRIVGYGYQRSPVQLWLTDDLFCFAIIQVSVAECSWDVYETLEKHNKLEHEGFIGLDMVSGEMVRWKMLEKVTVFLIILGKMPELKEFRTKHFTRKYEITNARGSQLLSCSVNVITV